EERLAAHAKTREPPDPARLSRWKTELTPRARAAFERVAGDLLGELGYEVPRGTSVRRRLGRLVAPLRRRRSPKQPRIEVRPEEVEAIPGDERAPPPVLCG